MKSVMGFCPEPQDAATERYEPLVMEIVRTEESDVICTSGKGGTPFDADEEEVF